MEEIVIKLLYYFFPNIKSNSLLVLFFCFLILKEKKLSKAQTK